METIEEAAYAHDKYMLEQNLGNGFAYNVFSFKVGVKWQKEQDSKVMYTEEEIYSMLNECDSEGGLRWDEVEKWFETNKKK